MTLVVSMGTMAVTEIAKLSYRCRSWIEQRVDITKLIQTLEDIAPHRDYDQGKQSILTHGHIQLKDITFGYIDHQPLFKNLTLSLNAGETVAFV